LLASCAIPPYGGVCGGADNGFRRKNSLQPGNITSTKQELQAMAVILNTEKQLAIQAWKQANRDGILHLELKTQRNKTRTRFLLYQVRALVLAGKLDDMELKVAIESCIIRQEGTTLTIESAKQSEVTNILTSLLGAENIEEIPGAMASEAAIEASQARMLALLNEKTTEPQDFGSTPKDFPHTKRTPYY
jgi:hypothetical protein